MKLTDAQIKTLWSEFIEKMDLTTQIRIIADEYPENSCLNIDYWALDEYNSDFSDLLLSEPERVLDLGEMVVQGYMTPEEKVPISVRVHKLPQDRLIKIRDIRANHLTKLTAVQGLVRKATEVRPEVKVAFFECLRCHSIMRVVQDSLIFREPLECSKDDPLIYVGEPGCGRLNTSTSFKLIENRSRYLDTQEIEIQEAPEEMRGGEQPQRLTVYLHDFLAGKLNPGDRVLITGVLHGVQRRNRNTKSTIFDINHTGLHTQSEVQAYEEITLTDEDISKITKLAQAKDIYATLINSIAPSIFGMDLIKEFIALQMFGGVPKVNPDGTRIRGDIHGLLIGDPGTGKSQLLKYVSASAPRAIYASGKASTSAGLTASARQDSSPMGQGRWILEAGALVLADRGICCIDEMDKMTADDRSSIHEAMEQQTISVHKAGIDATLNTRCAVLASANPQFGRFDRDNFKGIIEQINLPPTLLSRFDVIFPLADEPQKMEDTMKSSHILRAQKGAEMQIQMRQELENGQKEKYKREDLEELMTMTQPDIPIDTLRKYIAYARLNCFPVMSDTALDKIQQFYLEMREKSVQSIAITPRQLEALVRMAEASARIRLDPEVTDEDAERAIKIMNWYLNQVATDDGVADIDVITTGMPHTVRGLIPEVFDLIKVLSEDNQGVSIFKLQKEADKRNMPPDKLDSALDQLKKHGRIYEPKDGYIRLII